MRASRRIFLAFLATASCAARAQPAGGKTRKLGLLYFGPRDEVVEWLPRLAEKLRALGFAEREVIPVFRAADDRFERLPALAKELADEHVDVILTVGSPATHAAQGATTTIPIVTSVGDPVRSGFAASIARPGGNITGMSGGLYETALGQVDLLRQLNPRLRRSASSSART